MSIIDPVRTRVDLATLNLGFGTFPNAQPFSPRTAIGYQDLLEGLYRYVTRDLYRFLIASSGQATWDANIDTLLAAIDTTLAQQKSDIDTETAAALQAVIDSTIAITDPVTLAIINDPDTDTSKKLALLFAPLTEAGYVENIPGGYVENIPGGYVANTPAGYVPKVISAANAITGWWHVDDFGAVGDGTANDRVAIQAAIDAANTAYTSTGVLQRVFFGTKTYSCGPIDLGGGVIAGLVMKNGVELYGMGKVRVAPQSYWVGTNYALVRSSASSVLTTAGIRELAFDGNRASFSNIPGGNNQAGNIHLGPSNDVWLVGVSSSEANGEGIMVAANTTTPSTNLLIEDCKVSNCGRIGIQVSQFDGIKIINNRIEWTTDNAIDLYGEKGDTISNGVNFTVSGNTIKNCGNGIFPETVARGLITNNRIRNCGEGIHVNRINGEPNQILISENYIFNCDKSIVGTGDTGGITIRNNVLEGFNTGGVVLGGAGNVSHYYILNNTMNGNTSSTPLVLIRAGTNQTANIVHLRTMTKSKNRTYDTINSGPTAVSSTWLAALSPGDTPVG